MGTTLCFFPCRSDDDQPIYDDVAAENGSAAGKTNDESFEEEGTSF